jgi:two-component system OmpR family response regulator
MRAPTLKKRKRTFMQNSTRPTVMVVDDYDDVRAILKRWLEHHGCRVIEATSGREAVEIVRESSELILMDLAMSEIDGFGAAFRIRTQADLRDVRNFRLRRVGN